MGDEVLGFIKVFTANWEPKNWMFCDGRLLQINENQALFKVIGKNYGGDGVTTFALPDLRSRVPVGNLMSPVPPNIAVGQKGGTETVELNLSQVPEHSHPFNVSTAMATKVSPLGNVLAAPSNTKGRSAELTNGYANTFPNMQLNNVSINYTGEGMPHNNVQPYIGLNYIICVQGVYLPPAN